MPDQLSRMWEEYSYRHDHVWRLVFQLTAAAVALSIVPYLEGSGRSGVLRLVPPWVAVGLLALAWWRLRKEFDLLDGVKLEYLRQTGRAHHESSFRCHTLFYVAFLGLASALNAALLIAIQFCPALVELLDMQRDAC